MSAARSSGHAGPGIESRTRLYTRLEAALGVGLTPALLEQALTHRSYSYEHGGLPNNERLEFLGDAVLGLVVTEALFREHPDLAEGQLAKLRASVVSTRALAEVAREVGLGAWVRLGRGEVTTGGHDKNSILADTTEAVIGAVFIERGHEAAARVVRRLIGPSLERALHAGAVTDWKTALQEVTAARGVGAPAYDLAGSGPDHARRFVAQVLVDGEVCGHGEGGSKKEAEQQAAQIAYLALEAAPVVLVGPAGPAVAD